MRIRRVLSILVIAAGSCSAAFAQSQPALPAEPSMFYDLGLSYNPNGTPEIAGTVMALKRVSDEGTYIGSVVDFIPADRKFSSITTSIGPVVAHKVATIGNQPLWAATGITLAYNGSAVGWGYNVGGMAPIRVKSSNWFVTPAVRGTYDSTTGNFRPIFTLGVGYGQ